MVTRYTDSQILSFVCGVTGLGSFCSASVRYLQGHLATTNGSFSCAGCNLPLTAEQGTGTAELTPLIKPPCSKSRGNTIPSSLPRSERTKGLPGFLWRGVTNWWVWHSPSWTGSVERRGRKHKLRGEPLGAAVCTWSLQAWWVGLQPVKRECKRTSTDHVEIHLPGHSPESCCSAERVGCTVAKAVPAGRVCWPQWCRLELSVAQFLLKWVELACPCDSVEHTRGPTLRFLQEQKWSGSAAGVLCPREEGL